MKGWKEVAVGENPPRQWWWGSLVTHPHPRRGGLRGTPTLLRSLQGWESPPRPALSCVAWIA